jgi:hypothetical protein
MLAVSDAVQSSQQAVTGASSFTENLMKPGIVVTLPSSLP